MNRSDLQKLSTTRIKEAEVLLNNSCYDGAYYLSGYAVECALKAKIAKETKKYDFPDFKFIGSVYTHDLSTLLVKANLEVLLNQDKKTRPNLGINWNIVSQWNEKSRYETNNEHESKKLYQAITDKRDGVLVWLKKHW